LLYWIHLTYYNIDQILFSIAIIGDENSLDGTVGV